MAGKFRGVVNLDIKDPIPDWGPYEGGGEAVTDDYPGTAPVGVHRWHAARRRRRRQRQALRRHGTRGRRDAVPGVADGQPHQEGARPHPAGAASHPGFRCVGHGG